MEDAYYIWPFQKSFSPGCLFRIKGVSDKTADRLEINLQCGQDTEKNGCALSAIFRFNPDSFVVTRSFVPKKGWQQEVKHEDVSIVPGENFEIIIQCEVTKFKIAVNGEFVAEFPHVMPFNYVKSAELRGNVSISVISQEDCTLPLISKIEGNYPIIVEN